MDLLIQDEWAENMVLLGLVFWSPICVFLDVWYHKTCPWWFDCNFKLLFALINTDLSLYLSLLWRMTMLHFRWYHFNVWNHTQRPKEAYIKRTNAWLFLCHCLLFSVRPFTPFKRNNVVFSAKSIKCNHSLSAVVVHCLPGNIILSSQAK